MKYANKLTDVELKYLYARRLKTVPNRIDNFQFYQSSGDRWIELSGDYRTSDFLLQYVIYIDDYTVYDEFRIYIEATRMYRQFMLNKFGRQYQDDCFWYVDQPGVTLRLKRSGR